MDNQQKRTDIRSILAEKGYVGRERPEPSQEVGEGGLPDERRVERALDFLCRTDGPYARATARLAAAELRVKQAREIAFLEADGTQGERAAKALSSDGVKEASEALEKAIEQKELLKAQRTTATVVIEVWRSLNANQRRS
jgi:hypothetical protein